VNKKIYDAIMSGKSDSNIKFTDLQNLIVDLQFTYQYDENDNIFVASVPELEGCMAHGSTLEQAIKEINIAMKLWLDVAKDNGDRIPEPLMRVS
jgi:predicted RNase H-like HicB family nuclease